MCPEAERALTRVPDIPLWVDTRGMLLTGRAQVQAGVDESFVIALPARALISVLGAPPHDLVRTMAYSLAGDVNVMCVADAAAHVAAALPEWTPHPAIIHALPGVMPWEQAADPDVGVFGRQHAPSLDHLPEPLREELTLALDGYPSARFVPGALPAPASEDQSRPEIRIAAAWAGDVPAAFCHPVLQTETLWDVSVDTVESYRGRGLAGRAAREMVRYMRRTGKAPVWGALERNMASRSVAAKLGFVEVGRLAIFAAR